MRVRIKTRNGDDFYHIIDSSPIAVGGEGRIYSFEHNRFGECVLKLYITQEKAEAHRKKIEFLAQRKAPFVHKYIRYCWPVGVVYDEKGKMFIGFVMEAAFPGSRSLSILSDYNIGRSIKEDYPNDIDWHDRYELKDTKGLRNRIQILLNWALAIKGLHHTNEYCLVDIKPDNVFLTPSGRISILDIDSFQVKSGNTILKATAFTPNFFPAEAYDKWKRGETLDLNCDIFAYGICAYMVLTGTHPYSNVILKAPYNNGLNNLISKRIRKGLYLRGDKGIFIKRVSAEYDLHSNYDRLPSCIKDLFQATFTKEERPSIDEWLMGLKQGLLQI